MKGKIIVIIYVYVMTIYPLAQLTQLMELQDINPRRRLRNSPELSERIDRRFRIYQPKLIYVFEIVRHGARAPMTNFPPFDRVPK